MDEWVVGIVVDQCLRDPQSLIELAVLEVHEAEKHSLAPATLAAHALLEASDRLVTTRGKPE